MTASSELPLLAAVAHYHEMSMIAIDGNARITLVLGKDHHAAGVDAQSAVGLSVDVYFAHDPDHAKLYHEALNNKPQKRTFYAKNGKCYEVQVVPLLDGQNRVCGAFSFEHIVARDLQKQQEYEAKQERDQKRTNALLDLAQMTQQPEAEIIDYSIEAVTYLTDSTVGYVVLLEHAKDVLPFRASFSTESQPCELPVFTEAGTPHVLSAALTECLTSGTVTIHDDFHALPGRRTFPEGHHPINSHMNVAIMDGVKPVGILGVGNKTVPYTEEDAEHLTLLSQGLGNLLNRKKHAENLEHAKTKAEEASRVKSDFLAHMSHEIRTPLNGVIGSTELLSRTPLDEKQREYVQLIDVSGTALLFLINDILDFSKIEAGKLEIASEPFDLSLTIESVLASFVTRAYEKNLELAVSFCSSLPRIVYGDDGRIRQILLNLIGNAVKFTESGGVRIDVAVEAVSEQTLSIKFSVIDTGIGIGKDRIDHLFQAFSQLDASTSRLYGGTGLGLAISMKLVQLMKGKIGVESEKGKGSTFWFSIPFECDPQVFQCLHAGDCSDASKRDCPNREGQYCTLFVNKGIDPEYSTQGRTALVVDDNKLQCEALRSQLENWGMNCVVCGSGSEALRLSGEYEEHGKPFDLFIIDNEFSGESGLRESGIHLALQLSNQIKKGGNSQIAQVILLRAFEEDFDQNVLDEIMAETINKPVLASALFDAVMNKIYDVEKRIQIDSGIITLNDLEREKQQKSKNRERSRRIRHTLRLKDNLKSLLAGKIHVLLVEDNRVNQIVAKNILAEAGFTYDIAANGHEACTAVRNQPYDVVLMDCQMPEMDGYEATNLIRHWEQEQGKKRLPIIALTANATKEDVQKCYDTGMDAYHSKPISGQLLIRQIEECYENF